MTWIAPVIGAVALVLAGLFAARATKAAAQVTAEAQRAVAAATVEPQQRQIDLEVFRTQTDRLEREAREDRVEAAEIRTRMSRLEALVRAFAWTTDRWAGQMSRAGIEPMAAHPLVDEYNRTGV